MLKCDDFFGKITKKCLEIADPMVSFLFGEIVSSIMLPLCLWDYNGYENTIQIFLVIFAGEKIVTISQKQSFRMLENTVVTHLTRPLASCVQSSGFFLKRLNLGFIRGLWVADLSV